MLGREVVRRVSCDAVPVVESIEARVGLFVVFYTGQIVGVGKCLLPSQTP